VRTHTQISSERERETEDNKQKHLNASNVQKINCCQCARGEKTRCSLLSGGTLWTWHTASTKGSCGPFPNRFDPQNAEALAIHTQPTGCELGFLARQPRTGHRLVELPRSAATSSANQLKKVLRAGRLV